MPMILSPYGNHLYHHCFDKDIKCRSRYADSNHLHHVVSLTQSLNSVTIVSPCRSGVRLQPLPIPSDCLYSPIAGTYHLEVDHQKNSPMDLLIPRSFQNSCVFGNTIQTKIAFGLPGYTIAETNSLPLKIYFPEKTGSSPNHHFFRENLLLDSENVWYRYLRHPVIPLGVLGMFLGSIPSQEVFWCLGCNIILYHVDFESTSWLHPTFTKTFRYLKMEVLNIIRLFWGWFFPYISRIHTAYVGFQIPPFGWYLKCLVKHGTVLVVCSFHRKGIPMSITETFVVDLTGCGLHRGRNGWNGLALKKNQKTPLGGGNSNIFYFYKRILKGVWTFQEKIPKLGGGFKDFLFSPLPGEMIQFDEHIFQRGWFNHQLGPWL